MISGRRQTFFDTSVDITIVNQHKIWAFVSQRLLVLRVSKASSSVTGQRISGGKHARPAVATDD